jgi:hypothetical protein
LFSILRSKYFLKLAAPTKMQPSTELKLVVNRLSGGIAQIGPWDSARLVVEAIEFRKAVELFEPHKDELDSAAAVQLAIALEKCGRQKDAIDFLRARGEPTTDAMGTLAGRLKRRWLRERQLKNKQVAADLAQTFNKTLA